MQIQLKQREIEAALRMYINRQGINLQDKDISIVFTAGRKDSGLSADVSIEDTEGTGKGSFNHAPTTNPLADSPETEPAPLGAAPETEVPAAKASLFTK